MAYLRRMVIVLIAVLLVGTLSAVAQSDQRVTSENGLFSLQLPQDWLAETEGATIYLTNRQADARELFNAELQDREGIIHVTVDTPDRLIAIFGLDIDADIRPLGFLSPLADKLEQSGLKKDTGVFAQDGDFSRAYVRLSGENNQGQIHVVQIGGVYAVIQAVAAPNKLAFLQETVESIIESIVWDDEAALDRESTSWKLIETYAFDNGLATLLYPAGWYINAFAAGGLIIGNDESTARYGRASFPNDVAIIVLAYTISDWRQMAQLGNAVIDTPFHLMQVALELDKLGIPPSMELDDPVELTISGHNAASLSGTISEYDELQITIIEIADDVFAMVRLLVDDGELERWQPVALAIAGSITYNSEVEITPEIVAATPLPLTETYVTENSMFGIDYPAGWTFETFDSPSPGDWILSANIRNGDALTAEQIFPAGAVSIDVTVTDIENFVQSVQREPSEITAEDIVRFRWFGLSADQDDRVDDLIQTPAANGSFERGEIQPLMVGEHEAARVDMQLRGFNEGFALAYVDNDIVVEIRLMTAPGELQQWTATALAIAESFGYFG